MSAPAVPLGPRRPAGGSPRHRGRLVLGLLTELVGRASAERAGGMSAPESHPAMHRQRVRVLDCGGGTGALAVPLAVAGATVTVVDRSVDALAILSRRAADAGVGDRVIAVPGDLDAADLGLGVHDADDERDAPTGADRPGFDLVVAHDVLTAVSHPDVTLAAIGSRVAPGGWLSVQVVNEAALVLGRALAGDVVTARRAAQTPTPGAYELRRLLSLIEALGLEPEAAHGIGVLSEYVSGPDLEAHGAEVSDLAALDDELATHSPYREIASRLHVLARRPPGDRDSAGTAADGATRDSATRGGATRDSAARDYTIGDGGGGHGT